MACDRSPGEGEGRGWRPLNKGLSPQVTGGRLTGFLKGPSRAAPERQRGFRKETDAAQVPAERSEAACPDGAVTAGDWGWTARISEKAQQGRTGASARFPAREPKQWRCRRSEAKPHAPTGLSPQVTGGRQPGFPEEIPLTSV